MTVRAATPGTVVITFLKKDHWTSGNTERAGRQVTLTVKQ